MKKNNQSKKTVNSTQSPHNLTNSNQQKCTINNIGYISSNRHNLKYKDSNNKKNFKENKEILKQR